MVRFLIFLCFHLLSSKLTVPNNFLYCVLNHRKIGEEFEREIPQVQRKNNTKGRILFLRNHDFLLVCFKVIWNKIWCGWCINMLVMINWFIDGYFMDWWQRKWKSLLEKGIYKVKLSVEYVMFDHRSRWRNFCDFVGFIEVWYVLKCKIVNKASKISFVVFEHKLEKIGQHPG